MRFKTIDDIEGMFVQFVGMKVPVEYSDAEKREFLSHIVSEEFFTSTYITEGIRKESSILIFHMHRDFSKLAERVRNIMRTSLGKRSEISYIFSGIIRKSRYGSKVPLDDYAIVGNSNRGKYLVVYPFVKTSEWYLTDFKKRAEMMLEHIKVGRKYPCVKQLLAYSFGIDDQEFIVAYETDDLIAFQDLVMELRETEARRYTSKDTPIITAIYSSPDKLL